MPLNLIKKASPMTLMKQGLLRVARRKYERAIKIPAEFTAEVTNHTSESYQAWTEARPANDFERVRPYLEKTLEYSRQAANFFPGYDHIADPLIESSDYGMKAADIKRVFAELRQELVPLVSGDHSTGTRGRFVSAPTLSRSATTRVRLGSRSTVRLRHEPRTAG